MEISFLKLVFAAAVVFQHMASPSNYSDQANDLVVNIQYLVDGAVAGFFLISGFFFRPLSLPNLQNFIQLILRSSNRLLLPYFLFSTFYSVLMSVLGKLPFSVGLLQTLMLRGTGPQLYFLPLLFGMHVAFGFALSVRKNSIIALILLIFTGIISFLLKTASATGPDPRLIPFYAASFLLGYVLAPSNRSLPSVRIGKLLTSIIVLILLGLSDHRANSLLTVLILFSFTLYVSHYSSKNSYRIAGSGGIYLLHTPVLNYVVERALLATGVTEVANLLLSWIVTVVICFILTNLLLYYVPMVKAFILE